MPIGIQRLNARHQHPTPHIIFIKPLPGPSAALAEDFLSRVAAICHPILKAQHLSIMSLEEYEPNSEFIGRNFNAGEVIQLVLKARSGAWMDFRSVVMVMMHELAHCKQMNHSWAFWKVRNEFAGEMRGLWAKGYTGEGVWGPGRKVSGELERGVLLAADDMPRSLCGGTYRSGGRRKRKRKVEHEGQKPSYAEQQQKRIAKKFGVAGVTLGADEETRIKLEAGRKVKNKPRVTQSARGRELRAAAALARFGQQQEPTKKEEEAENESETESDYEDADVKGKAAFDINGSKLLDRKGHGMIKVCQDEDGDDIHVKEEMKELQELSNITRASASGRSTVTNATRLSAMEKKPTVQKMFKECKEEDDDKIHVKEEMKEPGNLSSITRASASGRSPIKSPALFSTKEEKPTGQKHLTSHTQIPDKSKPSQQPLTALPTVLYGNVTCPICSVINEPAAALCIACSHVLDTRRMPRYWRCTSATCENALYINADDCGLCGVCGSRKPNG